MPCCPRKGILLTERGLRSLTPEIPVQGTVLNRFENVISENRFTFLKVRQGARDFEDAIVGSGAEIHFIHGLISETRELHRTDEFDALTDELKRLTRLRVVLRFTEPTKPGLQTTLHKVGRLVIRRIHFSFPQSESQLPVKFPIPGPISEYETSCPPSLLPDHCCAARC